MPNNKNNLKLKKIFYSELELGEIYYLKGKAHIYPSDIKSYDCKCIFLSETKDNYFNGGYRESTFEFYDIENNKIISLGFSVVFYDNIVYKIL